MKASIGHLGINLSDSALLEFWKSLCLFLGFKIVEEGMHFDASDGRSYLCISVVEDDFKKEGFHRKRVGLNHVAFRVGSVELIDQFVTEFLVPRDIKPLYGGAKMYPEYADGYYAVYFEDADRIKIEVACEPPLTD